MKKRVYLPVFLVLALFFASGFNISTAAYAQDSENTEASESLEFLEGIEIPELPESLNQRPLEELKGGPEIKSLVEEIERQKSEYAALYLLHKNTQEKLQAVLSYDGPEESKTGISEVFPDGFSPVTVPELSVEFEDTFPNLDVQAGRNILKDKFTTLDVERYETGLQEDGEDEPKDIRLFYSNAEQKSKNFLETLKEDIEQNLDKLEKAGDMLYKENIDIEFHIGNTETYWGVKKNFDEGDPLYFSINYSTEGIEDQVPLEWKIESDEKLLSTGQGSLEPGLLKEKKQLYNGTIPEDSPGGRYKVELTLYPDDEEPVVRIEDFLVQGLPFEMERVFILDGEKEYRDVFKPGDEIILAFQYRPYAQDMDAAKFTWQVYAPSGKPAESLSKSANLKLRTTDREVQTKYIKTKISEKAPSGVYKYQALIEAGGHRETSGVVEFKVTSSFHVEIVSDKTEVSQGDKVVFAPRIVGGKEPYSYKWEFDTGETSSAKNVAFIFNQPGTREITLTVIDSTDPTPKKKSAKITIEVKGK